MKLISSPTGKELQLRGINLKVIQGGEMKPGDAVKKLRFNHSADNNLEETSWPH